MKFASIIVTLIIISCFNNSFAEIFYQYTNILTFETFKFDETGVKFYRDGGLEQEYHYLPLSPDHLPETAESKPITLIKLGIKKSGFCMIFKYKSNSIFLKLNSEKFLGIPKWKMAKIESSLINITNNLQIVPNRTVLENKLENYLAFDFYKNVSPWYYGNSKIDIQHSFFVTTEALIINIKGFNGYYLNILKTIYGENCYETKTGNSACKFKHEVMLSVNITKVIPNMSKSQMYNIEFLFKGGNEEEALENLSYRIFQTSATYDVIDFIAYLEWLYGDRVVKTGDENEVNPDTIPLALIE
jgi:hypothetical protein